MAINIVIVDDHFLIRMGTRSLLSSNETIKIIGEAENAESLFKLLHEGLKPDIVLLDIIMPGMNGIEIARKLKKDYPAIKVIMLSSETSEKTIVELSEIEINGFVSKASPKGELEHAINNVAEDIPYFGKDITRIMYDLYVNRTCSSNIKKETDERIEFTDKELEIIKLSGDGLMMKEIAEQMQVSTRTVETHRRNIFKKLNIDNSLELLKYGIKHGIIQL